jgi:hypothetical protein
MDVIKKLLTRLQDKERIFVAQSNPTLILLYSAVKSYFCKIRSVGSHRNCITERQGRKPLCSGICHPVCRFGELGSGILELGSNCCEEQS